MWNKEQQEAWIYIKALWNQSSEGKEIKIAMSQLAIEYKHWTSLFEQDIIRKDITLVEDLISQSEKEFIKKDILFIKRNTNQFEINLIKRCMHCITQTIKKRVSELRGKK